MTLATACSLVMHRNGDAVLLSCHGTGVPSKMCGWCALSSLTDILPVMFVVWCTTRGGVVCAVESSPFL
jgi:hypothetical protein